MIDKILHSYEDLSKDIKDMFPDFAFVTWNKEINKYAIVYKMGGIFLDGVIPTCNFHKDLDPVRFNILETKTSDGFVLSTAMIAAEKCFKGCKLICKEIKEGNKDTDIIYKYWQKERDSFFVLPWNKKSVTYLNS